MAIYVVSDLHGRKDKYDAVLNMLQDHDHLYIIGDVIDRGAYGIDILLDTMQRENVTLLMGNHEKMMIDYLRSEEAKEAAGERIKHFRRWQRNGALPTYEAYNQLDESMRKQLRTYLENLPYAICDLEVNQRIFYLCHAYPTSDCEKGILYADDLSEEARMDLVWYRFTLGEKPQDQRIYVVGHTPTSYYKDGVPYRVYQDLNETQTSGLIDIDCGLAFQEEDVEVGILCLDDLSVCYL